MSRTLTSLSLALATCLLLPSLGCRRHRAQSPADPPGGVVVVGPNGEVVEAVPAGKKKRRRGARVVVVANPGAPPDPGAPPPPPPPPPAPVSGRVLSATASATSLQRVTKDPLEEVNPTLSPNGTVLLFEARLSSNGQISAQTIVGVDPGSGGARTVYSPPNARSGDPVWLPDGSYVYVTDASGKATIVRSLVAAPQAVIAAIVPPESAPQVVHPSIAPDGKRIAFEASFQGQSRIVVAGIDANGAKLAILGEGHRPSWSPDGRRLAFTRVVNDVSQIFVMSPDGGGVAQVTTDAGDHDDPAWSPSSRILLFNSNRGGGDTYNLFAARPDGSGLVQLTEGNADVGDPSWGNDGWIYFDSNQAGGYDIWRLRPTGDLEVLGNRK
jgi:TolB protein